MCGLESVLATYSFAYVLMGYEISVQHYDNTAILLITKSRLKSSINTSTFMAGFALVSSLKNSIDFWVNFLPLQFQIAIVEGRVADEVPSAILIPHVMLTTLLISVHVFSLIIATRLLPELEAFIEIPNLGIPHPVASSHYWPVQLVWYLSNIVGILLFLVELVLATYIEFYPKNLALVSRVHIGNATLVVITILSVLSVPLVAIFFRRQKTIKTQYLLKVIHQNNFI